MNPDVIRLRSVFSIMTHSHSFDENDWPFEASINAPAYSTTNVIKNGYPILTVAHDLEGDWQFLCGETGDSQDMSIVCFGCIYELHPWIGGFSDLPLGWIAWRNNESESWQKELIGAADE